MPDNRTKTLHGNPKHAQAEQTTFIKRLRYQLTDRHCPPLKTDSINLFKQYLHLYRALEKRLAEISPENGEFLQIFKNTPWVDRSKLLETDINEMIMQLSAREKTKLIDDDYIFPAMQSLISKIQKADPIQLFGYFSVRCLGDAFGGQALKKYNEQLFPKSDLGSLFYNSASQQALPLSRHVNQATFSLPQEDEKFYQATDEIFDSHIQLFEEMEHQRTQMHSAPQPSFYKNKYAIGLFFAIGAVAVTTFYATNSTQPKI